MSLFEGGTRGVGWLAGGALPQSLSGTVYDGLTHIVDMTATITAAAGVTFPDSIDGVDIIDAALGRVAPRTVVPINILSHTPYNYTAVRWGNYKVCNVDAVARCINSTISAQRAHIGLKLMPTSHVRTLSVLFRSRPSLSSVVQRHRRPRLATHTERPQAAGLLMARTHQLRLRPSERIRICSCLILRSIPTSTTT